MNRSNWSKIVLGPYSMIFAVSSKETKMAEQMVATFFAKMKKADFIVEEEDNNMESFFAICAFQIKYIPFLFG